MSYSHPKMDKSASEDETVSLLSRETEYEGGGDNDVA